ncbi:MAG TPA: PDZ domain-containing protein [Steroidobacteraceae bacterium]|nr:PDZ domain-containing protein [Steroidobacteraceae bacterium]
MKIVSHRKTRAARIVLAALMATTGFAGTALATDEGDVKNQELEHKLEAARERLESAAQEVAELSQELSGSAMHDAMFTEMFPGRRAILGVNIGSRGDVRVDGVYITGVTPGGPADKSGIRSGDVIIALDGKKLLTGADGNPNAELLHRLREVKPGDKVKVQYLRDGKPVTADVTTRATDNRMFIGNGAVFPVPPVPPVPPVAPVPPTFDVMFDPGFGDMELVTLTPKLGSYFGADKGALVVRAPTAGLKLEEGDVITAIDGRQPQSGAHALRILRSYQPGEKVKVAILRSRKSQTLEVTMPERPAMGTRRYFIGAPIEAAPAAPAAPAAAAAPAAPPAPAAAPAPRPGERQ